MKRAAVLCALVAAAIGMGSAEAGPGGGNYIVVLKGGADSVAIAAKHKQKFGAELSHIYKHALKGYAARLTAAGVAAARAEPDVLFVSEDHELTAAAPPPPPENPQVTQRSVDRIDADESSARSGDGRGSVPVNVAVLDSGIDTDHPDLNVVGGANCIGDNGGFEDTYGHGTLVGGSIAAIDNDIGFVGVVPGAQLWAVRVLTKKGTGTLAQFICGVDWVTSTRTDADPANDIFVANASLGGRWGSPGKNADDGNCGRTNSDALHLAICRSVAAGVTYVVSAGNESLPLAAFRPASYNEVITVTAMSDTDGLPGGLGGPEVRCGLGYPDDAAAEFSNYGTLAEDQGHVVSAPGVCVPSTFLGGLYGRDSGTSFASPLVAGTAALCVSQGSCAGLSPAQVVEKIVTDAAAYNNENSGYGFHGDPLRPISGKYYGYLISAGQY